MCGKATIWGALCNILPFKNVRLHKSLYLLFAAAFANYCLLDRMKTDQVRQRNIGRELDMKACCSWFHSDIPLNKTLINTVKI